MKHRIISTVNLLGVGITIAAIVVVVLGVWMGKAPLGSKVFLGMMTLLSLYAAGAIITESQKGLRRAVLLVATLLMTTPAMAQQTQADRARQLAADLQDRGLGGEVGPWNGPQGSYQRPPVRTVRQTAQRQSSPNDFGDDVIMTSGRGIKQAGGKSSEELRHGQIIVDQSMDLEDQRHDNDVELKELEHDQKIDNSREARAWEKHDERVRRGERSDRRNDSKELRSWVRDIAKIFRKK